MPGRDLLSDEEILNLKINKMEDQMDKMLTLIIQQSQLFGDLQEMFKKVIEINTSK